MKASRKHKASNQISINGNPFVRLFVKKKKKSFKEFTVSLGTFYFLFLCMLPTIKSPAGAFWLTVFIQTKHLH